MTFTPKVQELIQREYQTLSTEYFNTAYFGPSPLRSKENVHKMMEVQLDPSHFSYENYFLIPDKSRQQFAKLLGVSADSISHATSSTDVINNLAISFGFKLGDIVAAINKDYPSNILPWMVCQKRNSDFHFELIDLDGKPYPTIEWLKTKLPAKTRIFNVSWVQFDTGKKIDLIELGKFLKEREIFFVVDATQGFGGLSISPEELKYIDVLTVSSYKWMCGPYGHAFAYYSPLALKTIAQTHGNWAISSKSRDANNLLNYSTDTLPGARKFDRGQPMNLLPLSCFEGALDLFLEIGLSEIEKHNKTLVKFFLDHYPKNNFELITPPDHCGNIICLKSKKRDPLLLEKKLEEHNIKVSVRQGNVRISFHLFNNISQVEKLITALG